MASQDTPALPAAASLRYRSLGILSLAAGAFLLLVSACPAVAFLVAPIARSPSALLLNTAFLSATAVLAAYGGQLLYLGRDLIQDRLALPFRLPSAALLVAAFGVALVVGQVILAIGIATPYLFPLWHVLASVLVPLSLLSYSARRLGSVSLRSVLAQLCWGGLVTIALALVIELVIGIIAIFGAATFAVVLLGPERLNTLAEALGSAARDPQVLVTALTREPLLMVIAGVTAIGFFVLIVPLLEEVLKATGPAILLARRVRAQFAPSRSAVVLWGLAAGAGYAATENMLNAQGSLNNADSLVTIWAAAMLLRAGTSIVHMIATAAVTIGWYQALARAKPARLVLLLVAAVSLHGIWNAGALLLGGAATFGAASRDVGAWSWFLAAVILLFLGVLCFGSFIALRYMLLWARRADA